MADLDLWLIKPSEPITRLPDSSADLRLEPLGSLMQLKERLGTLGPSTWLDPWAGIIDGDGWMAEVSVRIGTPLQEVSLLLHRRGKELEPALRAIVALCSRHQWCVVDLEAWTIVV